MGLAFAVGLVLVLVGMLMLVLMLLGMLAWCACGLVEGTTVAQGFPEAQVEGTTLLQGLSET